jgi:hypothetical protein
MHAFTFQTSAALAHQLGKLQDSSPSWALLYGVEGSRFGSVMSELRGSHPKLPVFGCTSFQGVFTERGFVREMTLLLADQEDDLAPAFALEATTPDQARARAQMACQQIKKQLGRLPSLLLLHATPGFEEQILAGVRDAFGQEVPVYGGSAADDTLSGNWRVFADGAVVAEGFLLIGLASARALSGGFVGGYLPTGHTGKVTRVDGRVLHEIDGKPAAAVYNDWTDGAIAHEVQQGGNIMPKTNFLPLARTVSSAHGMPRRLLAHPRRVIHPDGPLSFFAEFSVGEQVTLMTSTREPLVNRVQRAVQRARTGNSTPRGALLIYCAGCLGSLLDQAARISDIFARELAGVPFVGVATFGEQGTFFERAESWHGNLMCSAVLI